MTQKEKELEEKKIKIINQIKKIRQLTIRRLLFLFLFNDEDVSQFNITSRRAKHDYNIAKETLIDIVDYQNKYVDYYSI